MRQGQSYIRSGNVVLGVDSNRVWKLGEEISLGLSEFAVLWYLAYNHGNMVKHEALGEELVKQGLVGTRSNVETVMNRLRQKLGDGVIITYRGIGYRLA